MLHYEPSQQVSIFLAFALLKFFDQSLDTDSDIAHEEENVGVKVLKERLAILVRVRHGQA